MTSTPRSTPEEAPSRWPAWIESTVLAWGSTRSAAIIRIFLPMIIWSRWTEDNMFFKVIDAPDRLVFSTIFFFAGFTMLIGLWTRVSVPLMAAAMLVWHFYYGHHLGMERPLMSANLMFPVVALAFTDCGNSISVDRWIAVRRAHAKKQEPPTEDGWVWGLHFIAFLVSMMYFWGAVDKSDIHWLRGERMERYWMAYYSTSMYPPPHVANFLWLSAVGTTFLEYSLAIGLWFRVGRRWLMPVGVLLHLAMFAFLPAFQISWQMWLCYLAFFPVDEFHAFTEELLGRSASPPSGA